MPWVFLVPFERRAVPERYNQACVIRPRRTDDIGADLQVCNPSEVGELRQARPVLRPCCLVDVGLY